MTFLILINLNNNLMLFLVHKTTRFFRSSAVDVVAGATSRRGSYRTDDPSSTPQIAAGLSVDEDRPIRRRGSQL